MLGSIKQFFEDNLSLNEQTEAESLEHSLKLSTAALLIEMMYQDDHIHDNEIITIKNALKKTFSLNDAETESLYQLASQEAQQATDYYQFTRLIQENYGQQDKIHIIELLWRVAYADNEIDAYEEHMIRRIADLLYVPHSDFIQCKLRVQNSLNT
jgi:uncharacterized tellurite resistance protein B-like protein